MRRAVGIIRVSQVGGREGESFASPDEQRDRIVTACERDSLTLIKVFEELDVSGGKPLTQRPGLNAALEMIEDDKADVIVAAYFDRLVRSIVVQGELLTRVEAAGGGVLAVDFGAVSSATAAQWLSSTLTGAIAEYYRRSARERTKEAQARAVARGAVPFSSIPPGYRRRDDGRIEPDEHAPVVADAFQLRAEGATIQEVREHLAAHGITRSHNGTYTLLSSRLVLGEIHFGKLTNLQAHEAIVSRDVFARVQKLRDRRGAGRRSGRLLARLDVLRCAGCDGRMVVSLQTQRGQAYPFYRCAKVRADCPSRAAISAALVERLVTDAVRVALDGMVGRASADTDAQAAETSLERAQADLDATLRAFSGVLDEPVALERIGELRAARDAARDRVHELSGLRSAVEINATSDWDVLSVDARRALVRAVVDRVVVAAGRGVGRVSVLLRE
jgi:site-specific DNA recombinase